jgi:hypothetical protein
MGLQFDHFFINLKFGKLAFALLNTKYASFSNPVAGEFGPI